MHTIGVLVDKDFFLCVRYYFKLKRFTKESYINQSLKEEQAKTDQYYS
jgi:hypothetical protein